jgi:hypothetical protein
MDLSGCAALVIGGSGDLGRAIALALADAGADVAVTCIDYKDGAAGTCRRVAARGRRTAMTQLDQSDTASIEPAIETVVGELGRLDIGPRSHLLCPPSLREYRRHRFGHREKRTYGRREARRRGAARRMPGCRWWWLCPVEERHPDDNTGTTASRFEDSVCGRDEAAGAREHLAAALRRTRGKIYGEDGTAKLLGVKPTTLLSRLAKIGLKPTRQIPAV